MRPDAPRALSSEVCDGLDVFETEDRQARFYARIGRNGDDVRIVREEQAGGRVRAAVHFEFWDRLPLEALDEHEIAWRQFCDQLVERRLGRASQLVHERPAPARAHQHLAAASFAVPVGILAGLVHVEPMAGVLDEGNPESAPLEDGYQLLDQRGFAAARKPREAENSHLDSPKNRAAEAPPWVWPRSLLASGYAFASGRHKTGAARAPEHRRSWADQTRS